MADIFEETQDVEPGERFPVLSEVFYMEYCSTCHPDRSETSIDHPDRWITIPGRLPKSLGPRNIRVNAINLSMVASEGSRSLDRIYRKQIEALIPLGRLGKTEDIAPAVVFFASAAATFLH